MSSARSDSGNDPPAKIRRTDRACVQCRTRKQRCLAQPGPSARSKCRRCTSLKIECSFELDPITIGPGDWYPSQIAQTIADLQNQISGHELRLKELEVATPQSYTVSEGPDPAAIMETVDFEWQRSYNNAATSEQATHPPAPLPQLTSVQISPPLAMLRSLAVGTAHSLSSNAEWTVQGGYPAWDPIVQNILTEQDAKTALQIFFDRCHVHAPVLDHSCRALGYSLRDSSPVLFLALCSIGCRYWETPVGLGLHPKYNLLTALLDVALSRLLLSPSPSDMSLDSIRALLLYAQWMPLASRSQRDLPKTRYNDISAFSVLGLAIRYASSIRLESQAVSPFNSEQPITEDDMSRLRVWYNLVTCDANLMLTSGLPTSLDPRAAATAAKTFGSHSLAQAPGDLRVTALIDLVVIAHHATASGWSVDRPALDIGVLRRVNRELDSWETTWKTRLGQTAYQHCTLPFTSARWYRLALNSTSLAALARRDQPSSSERLYLMQCLEFALSAACHTLIAMSTDGTQNSDRGLDLFVELARLAQWTPDQNALERMIFTVDSAWISLTFAVTFLVLAYARGAITDTLGIVMLQTSSDSDDHHMPLPIRTASSLGRLLGLGSNIFDRICSSVSVHPAHDYRQIISIALRTVTLERRPEQAPRPMASPFKRSGNGSQTMSDGLFDSPMAFEPPASSLDNPAHQAQDEFSMNEGSDLQSLLEIMAVNGMEWSASLMVPEHPV